jgi:DNA modification methylase
MKISTVDINRVVPDPDNARLHDDRNIRAIAGSLEKFGQQKPIVIDGDSRVIAGNGTVAAAQSLGWKKIQVVRTELTGDEARAFALADNRTAELAEWDDRILKVQLGELLKVDFDIEAIGFEVPGAEEGGTEGLTDPDDVPEVDQNVFKVEQGQIWELGDHRLMCGDSTDKGDVDRLMDGAKADMVFTDPPYGMKAVEKSGVLSKRYKPIVGDQDPDLAKKVFRKFGNIPGIWWGANYFASMLPDASKWLVWDKNNGGSDQTDCELAWTNLNGVVRKFTMASEKKDRVHPTQKPVALIEWGFAFMEAPGILDPFLGSGSTLIACEKTGRKCYGMEIDPHYCSVIIKRWQDFTGREAQLAEGQAKA